jgi:hypothetical protein
MPNKMRVSGHKETGLGDRDAKITGNIRQQPHDDELSGADSKRS